MYSDKEISQLHDALKKNKFNISSNEFYFPCVLFIVLCIVIYYNSFDNMGYTCNNILQNTFLYVFASLVLFHILTMFFVKHKFIRYMEGLIRTIGPIGFILLFLLLLTGLLYLFLIYQTDIVFSHGLLIILISTFSYLFSYIFILLRINNLYSTVIKSLILGLILVAIGFYFKRDVILEHLKEEHYSQLLYIVLFVIFAHILFYAIYGYNKKHRIIYSLIIMVIFVYILLMDTKKILMITEPNCNKALNICNKDITNPSCNLSDYPSYPQKSFDIFHDLIILLQETAHIYLANN